MKPVAFKGANKVYTSPKNWEEEKDGKCGDLPVFEGTDSRGHNVIVSAWQPSEKDLKRLNEGKPLFLQIVGIAQPPVALYTDNPFEEGEASKNNDD